LIRGFWCQGINTRYGSAFGFVTPYGVLGWRGGKRRKEDTGMGRESAFLLSKVKREEFDLIVEGPYLNPNRY
jgi:hypothetical protein